MTSGRTVIVTGASRGIGNAVATALATQGDTVVAVARDAVALDGVVADLPDDGHRAVAFDVRDEAAWTELVADLPRIDGVVTAAGVLGPIGRIDTVSLDAMREVFEINVFGAVLAVRACAPRLAETGGSIVLFAGGGSDPIPGYDAYIASKAAVVRLAENLAAELAADGIRVNAVAPGFVATGMHDATVAAGPERAGADYHARTVQTLAAGGFPASEAAELVAFLVGPASAGITGRFLSARWDPWRDPDWLATVRDAPELLTTRRIDGVLFGSMET